MLVLMHTCGILTAGYVSTGYNNNHNRDNAPFTQLLAKIKMGQKINNNNNLIRVGGQQNDEKMH